MTQYFGLTAEQVRQIEEDFAAIPGTGWQQRVMPVLAQASPEEALCLKFLYAYLPASDVASYPPEFFLKAVRDTLAARAALSWSRQVTGELFFNYVLPVRLNNEDLTDHRQRFFRELYPRVKDLSMQEAALEVDYWCLENATYASTDDRTCSPLGTLANAAGRCGEESVLYVAALRSVGIPARQCYTPRWAHCDDNHAWVEVWTGDRWHWIGACEPVPALDRGWFVETCKRGMLVHARAFTRLISEPQVTNQNPVMAQVNILDHYAPVKTLTVSVRRFGLPVEHAEVRFQVINFSELYPILIQHTDARGQAQFMTGFGDLYVQVRCGDRFLCKKAPADAKTLEFQMEQAVTAEQGLCQLDMIAPPPAPSGEPDLPEAVEAAHTQRLAVCEQIRADWKQAHFLSEDRARELAGEFSACQDEIAGFLQDAHGNWPEILEFLRAEDLPLDGKVLLLSSLRKKDLSDTAAALLTDHLRRALPFRKDWPDDVFGPYLLCPRVDYEWLTAFRGPLDAAFPDARQAELIADPAVLWQWIDETVADCGDRDYATISASPEGLLWYRFGSLRSRRILFVAICRTFGVPARLSPLNGLPEYYRSGVWHKVCAEQAKAAETATLILQQEDPDEQFAYEKNFTVAQLCGGVYETLGLGDLTFQNGAAIRRLQPGQYRLLTASRQRDGSQLAELTCFELRDQETTKVILRLRHNPAASQHAHALPALTLQTQSGPAGLMQLLPAHVSCAAAVISTGKEPTEHLLNELLEQQQALAPFGSRLLLIAAEEKDLTYPLLQKARDAVGFSTALAQADTLPQLRQALQLESDRLPLVLDLSDQGLCVHYSFGYNVGTGDRLLNLFRKNGI